MKKFNFILVLVLSAVMLFSGCGKEETPSEVAGISAGNFTMENKETNSVAEEVSASKNVDTLTLCLDTRYYYDINIPVGVDYVTDFSKYVYAEEPSFTIQVLSNVNDTDFSNKVSIDNAVTLTQNVVRTKEGKSGPQEAAILLNNDRAIILRCYDCPEVFATVLESFVDEKNVPYEADGILYIKDYTVLEALSYKGLYEPSVINKAELSTTQLFKFDEGCLSVAVTLNKFSDVRDLYLKRLNTVSGCAIEEVYEDDLFYYAKAGNFYLGIYEDNYNTQTIAFGCGEESKCNIISILNQCIQ